MTNPMARILLEHCALYLGNGHSSIDGIDSGLAHKHRVDRLQVNPLGIEGDSQVDQRHHGGPDRVVHHFPREHYGEYRRRDMFSGFVDAPAMGENISTVGLLEEDLHIGDVLRYGTTLLQLTQPRSPCFKLDRFFGHQGFALKVQTLGKSGWFYRVLQAGSINRDDRLCLEERLSDISVAQAMQTFFAIEFDGAGYEQLLNCPGLAASWQAQLQRRLETGKLEDWRPRLFGPEGLPASNL